MLTFVTHIPNKPWFTKTENRRPPGMITVKRIESDDPKQVACKTSENKSQNHANFCRLNLSWSSGAATLRPIHTKYWKHHWIWNSQVQSNASRTCHLCAWRLSECKQTALLHGPVKKSNSANWKVNETSRQSSFAIYWHFQQGEGQTREEFGQNFARRLKWYNALENASD